MQDTPNVNPPNFTVPVTESDMIAIHREGDFMSNNNNDSVSQTLSSDNLKTDTDRLLDHLHRGGDGQWWAHYLTPDTGDFYTDKKTGKQKQGNYSLWFSVQRRSPVPPNWKDRNIYFCVHPQANIPSLRKDGTPANPSRVKARVESVAGINCVYAEYDVKDWGDKESIKDHLWSLPLYPSVIIDSGGGLHSYWLFADTIEVSDSNRQWIQSVQHAWIELVKGDPNAKDLARILRLPGTRNHKPHFAPNYPTVDFIEADFERLYTLAEIEKLVAPLLARRTERRVATHRREHASADQVAIATQCLKHLSSHRVDEYNSWIQVGMALHELGDAGFQLWDEWSQQSNKYELGCCDAKWDSFNNSGITLGSLVHWANEDDPVSKQQIRSSQPNHPKAQWIDAETGEILGELPIMSADAMIEAISAIAHDERLKPNQRKMKIIKELGPTIGRMSRTNHTMIVEALKDHDVGYTQTAAQEFIRACVADAKEALKKDKKRQSVEQSGSGHSYVIHEGMMQIHNSSVDTNNSDKEGDYQPICTFTAQIAGEIWDEFANITYVIEGTALRGGDFTTEVDTETYGSPSRLKIALEAAVGALDTVFAKMEAHLGPAIKLLSQGGNLKQTKRFDRTGWFNRKFYIPGRLPPNVAIRIPELLPYLLPEVTDEQGAVEALGLLMQAMPPIYAPVLLASVLGPPAIALAGLSNHRYGTILKGQTGTYKTGTAMGFMSIWGTGFLDNKNLIKWGTGATSNSIMHVATSAYELPLLLDNYKSNTGGGEKAFVETLHVSLEGGEKLRMLGKVNKLREVRDIKAFPICTGEDVPQSDPATTARLLIIPMRKNETGVPDGIRAKSAKYLSQIGTMWLDLLESEAGVEIASVIDSQFDESQRKWRDYLLSCNQGMPNVDRVASTLALNEACFFAASQHPIFGKVLTPYLDSHKEGLRAIARQMSGATADGLEAYRLMSAVSEMLATGRAILVKSGTHHDSVTLSADRDRIIGFYDGDGGAYLYPQITRTLVEKLVGGNLSRMSDSAIGNQLRELGWLASSDDEEKGTKTKRIGKKTDKMLHINKLALQLAQDGNTTDDVTPEIEVIL